jgi:sodium-independent sulfate anion transporter 11
MPLKVRVGETAFNTESTTSDDHPVIDCYLSESKAVENETGKTSKLSGGKVLERIKNRFRRTCTTKQLIRRLPIINWLQTYSLNSAFCDCMAGVTVALTAIPQGIAYGAVAGVPVEVRVHNKIAYTSLATNLRL